MFGKLRPGSDGRRTFRGSEPRREPGFGSAPRLQNTRSAIDLARARRGRAGRGRDAPRLPRGGLADATFDQSEHTIANVISTPDFFASFVAACAGAAGMLSLSTAKSGALIGVLISVTTIPAAANVGVTAAYGDWDNFRGSVAQLALNLAAILIAGTAVLSFQRALYRRRRRRHELELSAPP